MGIWDGKENFVRSSGFAPCFVVDFGVFCCFEQSRTEAKFGRFRSPLPSRLIKISSFHLHLRNLASSVQFNPEAWYGTEDLESADHFSVEFVQVLNNKLVMLSGFYPAFKIGKVAKVGVVI
uniref:Uncharacterized protein n=1 Tax=Arundo donax TaxID=35708 RepID=A0A0A9FL15_ARUDO